MGADNHPTIVPTNFEEVEGRPPGETEADTTETIANDGDQPIYHLWVSESVGADLKPTFIYISANSPEMARMKALYIGSKFGASHPCQIKLHPVELYV